MARLQSKKIYDPESEDSNLSARERADKAWGMGQPESNDSESQTELNNDNPSSATERAKQRLDPNTGQSVAEKEAEAPDGSVSAQSPEEKNLVKKSLDKNQSKKGRISSKTRNKIAVALVATVAFGVLGAVFFLPRVITGIISDKLTDEFMGRAKYAVQQRAEKYVNKYVSNVIGGELRGTCGSTVNRDCVVGNSIASRVYQQWRTNGLEDKLYKKYGIEFEKSRFNDTEITVKKYGREIGTFGQNSFVDEVYDAINTETKFEGILTRRHIRSVGTKKYGANSRCLALCAERDKLDQRTFNALQRLKLRILSRVSEVGSGRTAAYLLCLTTGCSRADLDRLDNEAIQKIEQKVGSELLEEIADDIERIKPNSFVELMIQRQIESLLAKVVSETTAKSAASAVPLAGQIYLAANAVEFLTSLDEKLKNGEISKYMRDVNAQEAALYGSQLFTMDDENVSNKSPFQDSWATYQLINGFAESRLWQEVNDVEPKSTIECKDGVVITGNDERLVCPETNLQPSNTWYARLESARNDPEIDFMVNIVNTYNTCALTVPGTDRCVHPRPRTIIKPALDIVNGAIGFVGDTLFSAFSAVIPGLSDFKDMVSGFVEKYASQFFTWASNKVLTRAISPDAEDQLALDQNAMGLDVMGNQFCRGDPEVEDASSIGCRVISATEQAQLDLAIKEDRLERTQRAGLFERYFSLRNSDSLASSATLAAVTNYGSGKTPTPSLNLNVASIFSTFSQVLGLQQKSYALTPQDRSQIFNVTQYGYAVDDPALDVDPESLTPEVCQQYEQARLDSAVENEVTGEIDYYVTNPCALDTVVGDTLTKVYDLDSESDRNNTGGTGTTSQGIAGLTGPIIPCQGDPKNEANYFGPGENAINWDSLPPSGTIGQDSAGNTQGVYMRDACAGQTNIRTVVIGSSIHGSENGGQRITFELLYNADLPDDVRIIAIPEVNKSGIASSSRKNANGVNLNRNFDYRWGQKGTSNPSDGDYYGPGPASEPETQNVQRFLTALGQTNLFISYHDCINWVAPSGPNSDQSRPIAQAYANLAPQEGGSCNGSSTLWHLLNNNQGQGFMEAWYANATGTRSLLVELNNSNSAEYMKAHAGVIQKLLVDGVIN